MFHLTGLSRHTSFRVFWFAQTLAALSAHITHLALPLLAALSLQASSFEMGLLGTMATLPNLLFGLLAGPWVDRVRRRPLMILTNLARAALLVSVPMAAVLHVITLPQLYAVLFLFGIATTVFDVAHVSYLPSLVGRDQVIQANSRLVASTSVAQALGPGLAGGLIQLLTAPLAVLIDAMSLMLSACLLATIRTHEADSVLKRQQMHLRAEIANGLRPLFHNPLLRSITGSSMIYLYFNNIMVGIFVLYTTQELRIAPVTLGTIYGLGGLGAVIGSLIAVPATHRFGVGYTLVVANLVGSLFLLSIPFADLIPGMAVIVLGIAQWASQMMGAVFYINQTSIRQIVAPQHMLGRMNASYRFLTMGMMPLGLFMGGLLGEAIGLRATLLLGGIGMLFPVLWLLRSPVRKLETLDSISSMKGIDDYSLESIILPANEPTERVDP